MAWHSTARPDICIDRQTAQRGMFTATLGDAPINSVDFGLDAAEEVILNHDST